MGLMQAPTSSYNAVNSSNEHSIRDDESPAVQRMTFGASQNLFDNMSS
jgi:hypothetical protein